LERPVTGFWRFAVISWISAVKRRIVTRAANANFALDLADCPAMPPTHPQLGIGPAIRLYVVSCGTGAGFCSLRGR